MNGEGQKRSDDGNTVGLTQHRITVLLVDDQAIIGEAVRRILTEEEDIDFHYCQEIGTAHV